MKEATEQNHRKVVGAVLAHVRDRGGAGGGLAELAGVAALSPFHFHRVFKRLTGRSPEEHLRGLRLVRAAVELRTTEQGILTIALEAGYENHESFSRAFGREMGISPSGYRRRHLRLEGAAMKGLNVSVSLVKVPVKDFTKACAFYREVLGLEEEFAVAEYGWAQYKTGGVPLCLYEVGKGGGDGKPGGEVNFHLSVSDAKRAFEEVKKRGGKMVCELVASDDGGSFFVVGDVDGNAIKVMQAV